MLRIRSQEPELIDLGHYNEKEYEECLYQLDRIGRFLGGDKATFKAFDHLFAPPSSILDVGCGGGLFTMRLAQKYPKAKVVGIDISSHAIAFAQKRLEASFIPNVKFELSETPSLAYPSNSFDVVTATLVCHHLTDKELPLFIKDACRIAKDGVIINDLHRHPLAGAGFAALAPILFRNRLIQHDGLLSIRRSFKQHDWLLYLKQAGIKPDDYLLSRHWAFRWILSIHSSARDKS